MTREWYVFYRSLGSDKKDGSTKSEQTPGQQVWCNSLKTNVKMIRECVRISDQFISGREVGCPACLSDDDLTNVEKGSVEMKRRLETFVLYQKMRFEEVG